MRHSKDYSKVLQMIHVVLRSDHDLHDLQIDLNEEGSLGDLTDFDETELYNMAERDFQLYIDSLCTKLILPHDIIERKEHVLDSSDKICARSLADYFFDQLPKGDKANVQLDVLDGFRSMKIYLKVLFAIDIVGSPP